MYAIVSIANKQFKAIKDQYLYTPHLDLATDTAVTFDQVLLLERDEEIKIGNPVIAGATVVGKVMGHVRGDKIIVFKKKRRKGYKKRQGHRQDYTKVFIKDILP